MDTRSLDYGSYNGSTPIRGSEFLSPSIKAGCFLNWVLCGVGGGPEFEVGSIVLLANPVAWQ